MTRVIRIDGLMLVPFARPKWEIKDIRAIGVSTKATYFGIDGHCAEIYRQKEDPIRVAEFFEAWSLDRTTFYTDDPAEGLANVARVTRKFAETPAEERFVDHYFEWVGKNWGREEFGRFDPLFMFQALLPLPQAHVYVTDALVDAVEGSSPPIMYMVDFAFWTGKRLVAVEIDGTSHVGDPKHVRKDRQLTEAGVKVVHILNEEVFDHGEAVVERLLPKDVSDFWSRRPWGRPLRNPFDSDPGRRSAE